MKTLDYYNNGSDVAEAVLRDLQSGTDKLIHPMRKLLKMVNRSLIDELMEVSDD